MGTGSPPTKREQNRIRRRQEYLDVASRMVIREGFDGLTMQAIADEVGAAVGTIYTYFNSKSALIAELQTMAISLIGQVIDTAQASWELELASLDAETRALARLGAFGDLIAEVAHVYPEEYRLQQRLLMEPENLVSDDDAARLFELGSELAARPMALIASAVEVGAIDGTDESFVRSVSWVAALNGIMMLDSLDRFDLPQLQVSSMCRRTTADLARGWGADPAKLERAGEAVEALRNSTHFVPRLPRWSEGDEAESIDLTDDAAAPALADPVELSPVGSA